MTAATNAIRRRPWNQEQYEANAKALPHLCYGLHLVDGSPVVIERGTSGFYMVDAEKWPMSVTDPEGFVKKQNEAMGVTPAQAKAMTFGSLFGWDTPGANPDAETNKHG